MKLDEIKRNFADKGEGQAGTTSLVVHEEVGVSKKDRRAKRSKSLVGTTNLELMKANIFSMPESKMKEKGK